MKNARTIVVAAVVLLVCGPALPSDNAPLPKGGPTIFGTVTGVHGKTVTILHAIQVDVTNATVEKKKKAIDPEAIRPGSRVRVSLGGMKKGGNNVWLAELVSIEAPDGQLFGSVESRTETTVAVAGQTISIAPDTWFGGFQDGRPLARLADLRIGYPVTVDVAASAGGLTAVAVTALGPVPSPKPATPASYTTLTGAVQAQEATVWTVDGKKVFLTPKTVVTGTIAVGDRVVIVGIGTPEGALLAESIRRKEA